MSNLWSAMVTSVLTSYAETKHILSQTQHGFRRQKSTHQALNKLIHVIEDAANYHQDLYIAYFDFTSAFNMVDHDRHMRTMYDLSFTKDAIYARKPLPTSTSRGRLDLQSK